MSGLPLDPTLGGSPCSEPPSQPILLLDAAEQEALKVVLEGQHRAQVRLERVVAAIRVRRGVRPEGSIDLVDLEKGQIRILDMPPPAPPAPRLVEEAR